MPSDNTDQAKAMRTTFFRSHKSDSPRAEKRSREREITGMKAVHAREPDQLSFPTHSTIIYSHNGHQDKRLVKNTVIVVRFTGIRFATSWLFVSAWQEDSVAGLFRVFGHGRGVCRC